MNADKVNTNLVWTKTKGVGWFLSLLMLGTFFFFFLAGSDFCANRKNAVYLDPEKRIDDDDLDPDDCAGFIICNIGKVHRQKCAPPQLFRADTMNCDLPDREKFFFLACKYNQSHINKIRFHEHFQLANEVL